MYKTFKKWIRAKAINYLIKDILNFVSVEDLLLIDKEKNVIMTGSNFNKAIYRREAEQILQSSLYKEIIKLVYYVANAKAVKYSTEENDMFMAKSWLFFTEYLTTVLKEISKSK